jgi:hypothetical protein
VKPQPNLTAQQTPKPKSPLIMLKKRLGQRQPLPSFPFPCLRICL